MARFQGGGRWTFTPSDQGLLKDTISAAIDSRNGIGIEPRSHAVEHSASARQTHRQSATFGLWRALTSRPVCFDMVLALTAATAPQTFPKQLDCLPCPQTFPKRGYRPQTPPNIYLPMLAHYCKIVLANTGEVLYRP